PRAIRGVEFTDNHHAAADPEVPSAADQRPTPLPVGHRAQVQPRSVDPHAPTGLVSSIASSTASMTPLRASTAVAYAPYCNSSGSLLTLAASRPRRTSKASFGVAAPSSLLSYQSSRYGLFAARAISSPLMGPGLNRGPLPLF